MSAAYIGGRARKEIAYWALGAFFFIVAVVLSVSLGASNDPAQRILSGAAPSTTTSTPDVTTTTAPHQSGTAHSTPVELLVPSLGIVSGIGELGLLPNRQVQVPATVHTVGWFRLGPTPGQIGSSVILGHVDSYLGPGIFFEIKTLTRGALIQVRLRDGVTTSFRVTSVVQYRKTAFPDELVYGSSGGRDLNLVTCGGTFDHATGHYESNIVVFSRLVGVSTSVS
jgi:hypothetical protein